MADVVVAIGTRKGLWLATSSDDRHTWRLDGPHFPMEAVYAVAVDTRGATPRLLAGATSEHWGPSVFRSDDLGRTWQEPASGAIRFPDDTGAALARVWQLQPDSAQRPGVVWAGTEPSALWRSEDGGETFELVRGLWDHPHRPTWEPGGGGQAIHTVVPHPSDDDRMLVAMSTGGVYRTGDGGATWAPANDGIKAYFLPDPWPAYGQCVHKVARHPDRPEQLFAQNHHGVYRSDDGGATWQSIAEGLPSDFGFPVVVSPARPGCAYLVPLVADAKRFPPDGALRVYRTTDAGTTWEPLADGLPQQGVYTSVLRDALSTDDADQPGIYLGTRDGVVYSSRDEGETWRELVRHLPDVLCVRAAVVG